ncbi:hypothetical protein MN116_008460 [Schistosoma mekongi]|uniref:RRM domain-containing protein n=1 Tax=Schistosoma mekongi TaxID=38744 RepID=A0AAE1Z687_SCHME|nr:hypothetical protein MN116_008460 [Schistosoma mekongi]
MCLLESIQMMTNTTTTTMPPPKAPQCPLPPNSPHNSNTYHSENSLPDDDQPIVLDSSCLSAKLNEDSMMILSQSIDSIHTVGTNNGDGTEHQVRTLFVSGLPLDAKPRELYLLFRSFKGYLSSTLKPAGKNGKLTAPVGFVTFESREQAEEAMTKLQGVKFDPDGNQHMRLEFARSNTKVTKSKITIPVGFSNVSGNNPHHNGLNQYNSLTNLGSCTTNMISTSNLTGMVANLQPSFFAQLAGTGSTIETSNGIFTTATDASTAMAAAAAAAAQWATIPGLPPLASAYENTAYLSSAAGLVQANNFRTLVPGNMNTSPYGMQAGSSSPIPSLQMVQAAIAHANAAAALCSANASSMGGTVCSPSTLTLSPQINTQVSFCNTGTSNSSSPNSGVGSSPATASTLSQSVNPNLRNNYFPNHQPNQSNVASFMAQLQQQQHQTLAAVHLNQHTNPPNTLNSTLGFANVVSAAAGLPPQMAAAAIGLLGGYNSIIRELAGSEGQLQPGLSPFQQNVNF